MSKPLAGGKEIGSRDFLQKRVEPLAKGVSAESRPTIETQVKAGFCFLHYSYMAVG